MIIIPAVDIKEGKCVRLIQGKAEDVTVYSDDPLSMAVKWQDQGAQRLHVVDLDGAFEGEMKNRETVLKIAQKLDIPVEVGGGIRNIEVIDGLIKGGVSKVILGTVAVSDPELLKTALEKWRDNIIVGIDSRLKKVAVKGWTNTTDKEPGELAVEMEKLGVSEIIVTDISKDGMLEGTNVELFINITNSVKISVIASGGISGISDVKRLKELNIANLTGVIIGKALYSGNIELADAIAAAEGRE
ncbi:1-(5-phosphoribosyl)-5-[(5-phosphoribosylamino)methylideneamino]imidazole-4-carboxamide isomerase [Elusimicrobiota bacterium]